VILVINIATVLSVSEYENKTCAQEYFAITLQRKAIDGDCHLLTLSLIINLNKKLPLLLESVVSKLGTFIVNPDLYTSGSIKGWGFLD
jgi:hypothetical protein